MYMYMYMYMRDFSKCVTTSIYVRIYTHKTYKENR